MPNEIYHRSEWGNPKPLGWGNIYFDADATNELYKRSDNYENSDGTDEILRDISNKASIVLTPTAYDNGSINTVIPTYGFGSELVTNGTFDTNSDWTKGTGWSISGGKAVAVLAGNTIFNQTQTTTLNQIYKVVYTVSDYENGSVRFQFSGGGGNTIGVVRNSNGTYTEYIKSLFNHTNYRFKALTTDGGFTGKIDNLSVKEVTEADFDFTRASIATRVNEQGLIEEVASGIPRIDYTSGFGSWLLEPQSTNLITYSEDFSQWGTVNGAVVTDNFTTSPDGTQNAAKVVYDGTSLGRIEISTGASGTNTQSIYLKTVSGTQAVSIGASSSDLTEVTVTSEWQRFTHTGSGSYPRVLCNDAATIYVWGAQLEQKSFATSYIPTEGSTVTRSADVANNSGNADLFNDSEGVLYANISALADDDTTRRFSISDGTNDDRVLIGYSSSNRLQYVVSDGGSVVVNKLITVDDITTQNKTAFKYKLNDCAVWINGFEVDTDLVATMPSGLNTLNFDQANGTENFYGKTKELAVFKEALTDAELESLTSWISFVEMATDLEYTIE
jgi:hypothetical protein